MSDTKTELLKLSQDLKSEFKRFKRKFTPILKKYEEFLFNKTRKFTEEEIRIVLVGREDDGLKGFIHLVGLRSRIKGSLKKSAFLTLELMYKLFEKHHQKEAFVNCFYDLEDDEFKLMKLSNHVLYEKNKNDFVFHLIRIIHEKRPHLSMNVYLESKNAQAKFTEWLKTYQQEKNKQVPTKWKDDEGTLTIKQEALHIASKKKEKAFKDVYYNISLSIGKDYYEATFENPLADDEEEQNNMMMSNSKPRMSSLKKQDLKKYFKLKVKELELPPNLLPEELTKIVQRIHLDSPLFDQELLIKIFTQKVNNNELVKALERLLRDSEETHEAGKNLIYFYEEDFFNVKGCLKKMFQDTIKNESRKDAGVSFTLRNRLRQIKLELDQIAVPLIKKKQESDDFKRLLHIFQRYWFLMQLPLQVNNFFLNKDMKGLAQLFKKNTPYLKKLSDQPFFNRVCEETNKIVSMAQKEIFEIISQKAKKFESINELIHLLFTLNIEQDPINELIQKVSKKIVKLIEYEFPNSILEEKYVPDEGPEGVTSFYNKQRKNLIKEGIIDTASEVHDDEEEENLVKILSSDGDMLSNFIQEVSLTEDKQNYYNRSKFENFFDEFFQRIENIALLCKAYLKGNYDIQLKEIISDLEEVKDKRKGVVEDFYHDIFQALFDQCGAYLSRIEASLNTRLIHPTVLKSDIKHFGRTLTHIQKFLEKVGVFLEDIESLKNQAFLIFLKIINYNLQTNVFPSINYKGESKLILDFFEKQYSPYMFIVFDVIIKEFKHMKKIPSYNFINKTKLKPLGDTIMNIINDFCDLLKTEFLGEKNPSEQTFLSVITNLKFFQSDLLKDTLDNIFKDFEISHEIPLNIQQIKDSLLKEITAVLERKLNDNKKDYIERRTEIILFTFFENLMAEELLSNEKFLSALLGDEERINEFKNFKKENMDRNASNLYSNYTLKDTEQTPIRYYVYDILTNLVLACKEINMCLPQMVDEMMKTVLISITYHILRTFKMLQQYDKNRVKQVWFEMEFFQNMTTRYQSPASIKQLTEIYHHLKRFYLGAKEITEAVKQEEIFTDPEKDFKKKDIRNNKFKSQINFRSLIYYG